MDGSAAPIDDAVLELIVDRAQTHSLVEAVHTEHTGGVTSLVTIELDCDRYPDNIQDARIEIQWYTNGD